MNCMNNPKQIVMNLANKNPMLRNLIGMDSASVENFARNYCKEKGIDFDKEFSRFKKQYFGL